VLVAVIVLVLLVIWTALCIALVRFTVLPKTHSVDGDLEYLKGRAMMQGEDTSIDKEYTVKSYDGYELYVGLVQGDPENKHYVILNHGYTSTRYGTYKYTTLYRKFGYNCIIYDNRGHGANIPTNITFGVRESKDLMAVIADTYERYGQDIKLGMHGESMGSGLQLCALKYQPKVDFIVNDCGYADILSVLQWKCNQAFKLPGWMATVASPYAKLLYGYSFHEVRPIDNLAENEIPICFVHGDIDDFVLPWHSQKMQEANKGYSELHSYEGANHALCIEQDTKRYLQMLMNFLAKVYPEDTPKLLPKYEKALS
jgi:pimeloyl-ACP methyl ester carboxylesterase